MKSAVVEREALGGVCLNWGCIPTKALLRSAEVVETLHHAGDYGVTVETVRPDFKKIIQRSRDTAKRVSLGVSYLMKKNKIAVVKGRAEFSGRGELAIHDLEENETERLKAPHVIVATGGRARELPFAPFDGHRIFGYKRAMTLANQPASMIIIGGGAIGVEFGYFYRTLGTEVTLVEMLPHLLPIEDEEICQVVERSFKKSKTGVYTGARVTSVDCTDEGVRVRLVDKKGKEQALSAETLLVAVGVRGNIENLGLERIGVETDGPFITVDESYRTSVEGVYAIGDVCGPPLLAHAASHEGIVCVERLAGKAVAAVDYDSVPGCTYCQPQVASIGLTEARAREKIEKVRVGRFQFRGLGKAVASGHLDGLVKLIFDGKDDRLLGAHLVGHDATELLGELILAKNAGVPRAVIGEAMHAHPTLSEAVMEAAREAAGEALHV
jgi:dihydrolipoamide dehydrogenase